ncbi:hypothetical protein [Rhodococcus sp. 14-2483-1-2]|uniref:hypothetical protein n=1 Tax=Rhodococcus sp. 14-2483-1-2 TaxID=2023147 RepID=UPI00113FF8F3|nr:hypothetical protein [Rhodococcus sp. 14-2483-1-2]
MADYALERLGPRDFEHLTQAMLLAQVGPNVEVYGDGPDGGRDATFHGEFVWDDDGQTRSWSEVTVFQAKFLQRPVSHQSDFRWLKKHISNEIAAWEKTNRHDESIVLSEAPVQNRRFKFQNILFITNVKLTPATSGTLDRMTEFLSKLIEHKPIKSIGVWHYDKLCRILDSSPAIRGAYAGLITPGDLLARLHLTLPEVRIVDVGLILIQHARNSLAEDQAIRLGESGDPEHGRILIHQIAIDLKVDFLNGHGSSEAAKLAIETGNQRFIKRKDAAAEMPTGCTHLLIFGGPGQGKTTISQLITLAYRLSFANDIEPSMRVENSKFSKEIEFFRSEQIPLPTNRRWPFRVDLAKYAETNGDPTWTHLIKWCATLISERAIFDVTPTQLLSWLKHWPSVFIFDGLDEVVSSDAREKVATSINQLEDDARSHNLDLYIIVTSRPQGYNNELSRLSMQQVTLCPLTKPVSISYARRLIYLRHGNDPVFASEILRRFHTASESKHTSRLLSTPLQTTILTLICEDSARVPQSRWELFNLFYETLYKRESNKTGSVGHLLGQYKHDINYVHEAAARWIEFASNDSTRSVASIPRTVIKSITYDRLLSEGQPVHVARDLAAEIVRATLERLVFLVPMATDSVGFELRSLREYLVARSIASGDGDIIIRRIRLICNHPDWQNIALLAVGSIFSNRQELRGPAIEAIRETQAISDVDLLSPAGSSIALELVADNVANNTPRYLDLLFDHALQLLDHPVHHPQGLRWLTATLAIASSMDGKYVALTKFRIQRNLGRSIEEAATAWGVLASLRSTNIPSPLRDAAIGLDEFAARPRSRTEINLLNIWSGEGVPKLPLANTIVSRSLNPIRPLRLTEISGTHELQLLLDEPGSFKVLQVGEPDASFLILPTDWSAGASFRANVSSDQFRHVALHLDSTLWCIRVAIASVLYQRDTNFDVSVLLTETYEENPIHRIEGET